MITPPTSAFSRIAAISAAAMAIALGATQPAHAVVDNHLTHVSVGIGGAQPDGDNGGSSALSADGRYVVFVSSATNLTPGVPPTGGLPNLYVRDTVAGTTRLISHNPAAPRTTWPPASRPSARTDGMSPTRRGSG